MAKLPKLYSLQIFATAGLIVAALLGRPIGLLFFVAAAYTVYNGAVEFMEADE